MVGAGVAGITLAREFTGSGLRVILLESGGAELDQVTHYAGSVIGRSLRHFPDLAASLVRRQQRPLGPAVVSTRATDPQTRALWLCALRLGHCAER
jgi:choline dehydrogenase-like flavoprotein